MISYLKSYVYFAHLDANFCLKQTTIVPKISVHVRTNYESDTTRRSSEGKLY